MRIKKSDTTVSVYDFSVLTEETKNLYETVAVISKRAKAIGLQEKNMLTEKFEEFKVPEEELEEVFENEDQIALSKYYEKMPKPSLVAIKEFVEHKLQYRYQED